MQETFCSSTGLCRSALYSKSPKPRLTARLPSSLGGSSSETQPPAASILAFSVGWLGLWSTVSAIRGHLHSGAAKPLLTAASSPAKAWMCGGILTTAGCAVASCSQGPLTTMQRESPALHTLRVNSSPCRKQRAPTTVDPDSCVGSASIFSRSRRSTADRPCSRRLSDGSAVEPSPSSPSNSLASAGAPSLAAKEPPCPSSTHQAAQESEHLISCASSWLTRQPCISATAHRKLRLPFRCTLTSSTGELSADPMAPSAPGRGGGSARARSGAAPRALPVGPVRP
mmetsp:Transcript_95926/g.271419  ORF Transcript_95926/g.271419 Transcript_95926/m.271419 type:complete len:284 (+) Transcript_95926:712-1563(+)